VAQAVPNSPLAANYMNFKPSEEVYELFLDIVNNRKFEFGRGWNPDDPRSGLFVWPPPWAMGSGGMVCDHPEPFLKGENCNVPSEFFSRCSATRATTWTWVAAESDQGIFMYLFNVSGLGSTRWVAPGAAAKGELEQGRPYFKHYQGTCKPHIVVAKGPNAPGDPICHLMDPDNWFWNSLWKAAQEKHGLGDTCPSFGKFDQGRNKTKGPTR